MIAAHRAAIRNETLISVAINALVPAGLIGAIGVTPPTALDALLPGLLLGSGLATLLMTLVVTHLVRGRTRRGPVPLLALADAPTIVRALPRHVAGRAVSMALLAIFLLVPLWSLIVTLGRLLPFGTTGLFLFNVGFGASVGATMTPPVVIRALADAP